MEALMFLVHSIKYIVQKYEYQLVIPNKTEGNKTKHR